MKWLFILFNYLSSMKKNPLCCNSCAALKVMFALKMIHIGSIKTSFSMTDLCNFSYCHFTLSGGSAKIDL